MVPKLSDKQMSEESFKSTSRFLVLFEGIVKLAVFKGKRAFPDKIHICFYFYLIALLNFEVE